MQSQGSSLLGGYGFTNSPAYTVNSDGTMLWSTPTIAQGSALPFIQGLLVLSGLPVGYTFNLVAQQHGAPLMQYHLVADKNLLRVYVEVLIAGQNIGLPVLWADRFGHYVTFQWTQVSSGLPTGITSMVRVDALNQRSQGVTLRYANWSDTTIVHDLMRIDFVNFSGPAALIQGYSGYASQEPSAFVGPATSLHPAQSIPAAIGGMISRPRYFTLGDPYSVAKPSWNNQGAPAGTQPTLPPTNSGLASIVWTLTYDANLAEIENIVSQTNVTTDFSYGNYSLYSPNCNLPLPMLLRGITQTVETDNSQSTPPVRIRSWVRSLPATTSAPWTVTYTDYWSSVGSPDRTTTYTYSPMSNPVDYGNGFLLSEITADNNNVAWSTITSTSSTTLALGGGGLDNSLSMPATVAVARNNENPTNTTYTYLDGTALQIASITRQILMNGTQTTFLNQQFQYNPQWPMLEANQVNQVKVTRTNLATGVAQPQGTLTTSQAWDQANLLELQNSYCNAGAGYQHGQSFSYTSDGKPYQKWLWHLENGVALGSMASPQATTISYDAATGQPNQLSTTYTEIPSGTGTLTQQASISPLNDRPTSITDERGVTTGLTYDLYGRPSLETPPLPLAPLATTYPDAWTVTQTQGPRTTTTHYDGFGRPISKTSWDGIAFAFAYDLHGRPLTTTLTTAGEPALTQSSSYDILDRITSRTGFQGVQVTQTYAPGLNGNNQTTCGFGANQVYPTTTSTDPFGQVVQVSAATGDLTTRTFDGWGHVTQVQINPAGGGAITPPRSFSYDSLGRLIQKTEPETGTLTFASFDSLN